MEGNGRLLEQPAKGRQGQVRLLGAIQRIIEGMMGPPCKGRQGQGRSQEGALRRGAGWVGGLVEQGVGGWHACRQAQTGEAKLTERCGRRAASASARVEEWQIPGLVGATMRARKVQRVG